MTKNSWRSYEIQLLTAKQLKLSPLAQDSQIIVYNSTTVDNPSSRSI